MKISSTRRVRPSEQGYILVGVIFLLAILIITMAVAAPKVAKEIQRDRELETMQRGKQYIRAIRMYYKKFNAYPPNVDALIKAPGAVSLRFLRKKYVDPTTGKEEWKAIHFGQNKAPTAMGFFGQPLAGTSIGGVGAGGVSGASTPGSSFMSPSIGASGPTGPTDTSGISGASGSTGSTGTTGSTDLGGQTFGGLGIIGFSPNSPKESILVYKKKNHYNEWEFVYDPISEQTVMGSSTAPTGAVPASGIGNGSNGNNSGFGGNNSSFGGNNSSLGGSSSGTNGTSSGSGTSTQP